MPRQTSTAGSSARLSYPGTLNYALKFGYIFLSLIMLKTLILYPPTYYAPIMSVLSGKDVANYLENISREQVQVNGVDLTVERIFRLNGVGVISCNDVKLPEYVEVQCNEGKFFLEKGVYVVQVKERISIPLDAVGICLPRSSLVRMGVQVGSALWDSGYVGYSKILLNVENPIIIEKGARFAQLILIRCERKANEGYGGRYQNEQ